MVRKWMVLFLAAGLAFSACEQPAGVEPPGKSNDPQSFVPVTEIAGVPATGTQGTAIDLGGVTVTPPNATNTGIVWSVAADSGVSADKVTVGGTSVTPLAAGTLKLTARIANGKANGTEDYTKTFIVTVEAAFIPVTEISGVPTGGVSGAELDLGGAVAVPSIATNTAIAWTVADAGTTGVAAGPVTGNTITPAAEGTLKLRGTVANGAAEGADYTEDFEIPISAVFVPVTDITGVPAAGMQGAAIDLSKVTVTPNNATNTAIVWSKAADSVNAVIDGTTVTPQAAGTLKLTATVAKGKTNGTEDYTKDFEIDVAAPFVDEPGGSSEYPEGWEDWEEEPEEPPVVTGIEIAALPDTTVYPNNFAPEDVSFAGLVVNRVWDNGQTTALKSRVALTAGYVPDPEGYTIDTANIKAVPGWSVSCQVFVRWGSFKAAEFSVVVDKSNRVLQSIAASGSLPASQELGKAFQFGSFKVTGTYKDGDTVSDAAIDAKAYKVSGYDMRKRGNQTVTVKVNGKSVGEYPVTVRVPASATVKALEMPAQYIPGKASSHKPVYLKGQAFSFASAGITATVTANGQTVPLTYGNGGLTDGDLQDPDGVLSGGRFTGTGNRRLGLKVDDAPAVDIPFYVIDDVDGVKPRVYFDYGYRQTEDDKTGKSWGDGKYYVKSGSSIVLAPVRYLIGYKADHTDDGVSYAWTVTGGAYDTSVPHNGETFAFKPAAPATYAVTVSVTGRNFITGYSDTKSATTDVVCYSGTVSSSKTFQGPLKDFAPGQFTERGTGYGWSLGAVLGYEVWDTGSARSNATITGNGFESWHEPGIVWVQADDNGNGIPDEMWYEVKGSEDTGNPNLITRRYALTYFRVKDAEPPPNQYGQIIRTIYWVDQRGRVGIIGGGWPTSGTNGEGRNGGIHGVDGDWITFTGTILRDSADRLNLNGAGNGSMSGYVDIYTPADKQVCKVDVKNAIKADGTPAETGSFRFIKVQTAFFDYGNGFGETSTEIVTATGLNDQSGGFANPLGSAAGNR
ncbi:MAG: bacterial Ig-like domain-containing protein [Spirochaetaceae bacterium]|jgi:hypothetical protein|nr:bacterial Ig-like domain-containing protein [Spirochaetaceae bacterium]